MNIDTFTRSYIETAFWSTTDDTDENEPLDENYGIEDLSDDALATMIADCAKFQLDWAVTLGKVEGTRGDKALDDTSFGHDFWLTRNGHGAGFWDGDYAEPMATILAGASKAFGTCDLIVGDDGQVHCS